MLVFACTAVTAGVSFLSALNGLTSPSKQDGHSPLIRAVGRSENPEGGISNNVLGIICPLVEIGLIDSHTEIWGCHDTPGSYRPALHVYLALGAECITENSYSALHKQTIQSDNYTSDSMGTSAYLIKKSGRSLPARAKI